MASQAAELRKFQLQMQAELERRIRLGLVPDESGAHVEYQKRPLEWMADKLGIPRNTIQWSLNPEYQNCTCNTEICQGGGPHVWDGDVDPLLQAMNLVVEGKSVALASGTTTGKTHTMGAAFSLFFLAAYYRSNVLSIAPKRDLLLKNLWKEKGSLWPSFKRWFPTAEILSGSGVLRMLPGDGEQELWTASAFGAAVGAQEELASNLKGFHRASMLWIIEEGQGMDPAMVETVVKTASSDFNPIVMLGNPESVHDQLAAFGRRSWVTALRISALDFPNVVCNRAVVPGGRSRDSIARDLSDADGDITNPKYLSQVRGIAPKQAKQALIQLGWCEAAAKRWDDQTLRAGPLALGVDVADSPTGDKSAISRWQGAVCTEVEAFHAEDASAVGRMVYREITNTDAPIDPRYVGIDSIGVGASTVNELKRLGLRIRRINGAERAIPQLDTSSLDEENEYKPFVETERYANTRALVYWRLREDLRLHRIGLPNDPLLFQELTAMETTGEGPITLVAKDKVSAKLGRSPDRADAVAYGNFARPRVAVRQPVADPIKALSEKGQDTGLERLLARESKRKEVANRHLQRALRRTDRRKVR